jgi:BASS family bile acid:Na+ symporter
MMHDLLAQLLPFVALAFLASALFSLGLDLTTKQVIEPLRDRRLLGVSLGLNIILVPLLGIVISRVIPMGEGLAIGIVVFSLAAGTEGGPKFVQLARGNAGFAVGLLAVMLAITIVLMPAVLSIAIPGAHVDRGALLAKLLLAAALPMALGLFLRARHEAFAIRLGIRVHRVAVGLLGVFLAQVIYVNIDAILALQSAALLGGLLFFAVALAAGYLLGGPRTENRRALAMMTYPRNGPISMTAASQVFADDPSVLVMVTVLTVLSAALGAVAVIAFRRMDA